MAWRYCFYLITTKEKALNLKQHEISGEKICKFAAMRSQEAKLHLGQTPARSPTSIGVPGKIEVSAGREAPVAILSLTLSVGESNHLHDCSGISFFVEFIKIGSSQEELSSTPRASNCVLHSLRYLAEAQQAQEGKVHTLNACTLTVFPGSNIVHTTGYLLRSILNQGASLATPSDTRMKEEVISTPEKMT